MEHGSDELKGSITVFSSHNGVKSIEEESQQHSESERKKNRFDVGF